MPKPTISIYLWLPRLLAMLTNYNSIPSYLIAPKSDIPVACLHNDSTTLNASSSQIYQLHAYVMIQQHSMHPEIVKRHHLYPHAPVRMTSSVGSSRLSRRNGLRCLEQQSSRDNRLIWEREHESPSACTICWQLISDWSVEDALLSRSGRWGQQWEEWGEAGDAWVVATHL